MTTIEHRLSDILRAQVRFGGDRLISPDEPLSVAGLDSLAILNFLTSVEKQFDVQFPDQIWAEKDGLTLGHFARLVRAHTQAGPPGVAAENGSGLHPDPEVLGDRPHASSYIRSVVKRWYAAETFILLSRNLHTIDKDSTPPKAPLKLREATLDDFPALRGFWPVAKQEWKEKRFRERLGAGFFALTAWWDREIVGIDWVSPTGDFEPNTGLRIVTSQGTAYAFDLFEKYQGKGIGYALLLWSLHECRKRGYDRQVTLVSTNNTRMLTVGKKLIGYKEAGRVRTRKIMQRPHSVWSVGTTTGHGGVMTV